MHDHLENTDRKNWTLVIGAYLSDYFGKVFKNLKKIYESHIFPFLPHNSFLLIYGGCEI